MKEEKIIISAKTLPLILDKIEVFARVGEWETRNNEGKPSQRLVGHCIIPEDWDWNDIVSVSLLAK